MAGKKTEGYEENIEIPDKVDVTLHDRIITVKGPKGSATRKIPDLRINVKVQGKSVILSVGKDSKKEKKLINALISHIENLMEGVQTPYIYTMKICAGHFPMNVAVTNNQLVIKNFIGEKVPRTVGIKPNTKVEVKGAEIIVESVDKELAGQMASAIEQTTRRPGYDLRIFQDGIYITNKAGKPIS